MRIGHGYDAHRFDEIADNANITLGGVKIPYSQTLIAHSDGDVLIHALCDAILGALALGDIGRHFPDNDQRFNNIDSRKLLTEVIAMMQQKKYQINNVDLTIIAQAPKMAPYIEQMCQNISQDCRVSLEQVNIKATTTENMGFTGRKEGIACHAVVLLKGNS